MIIGVAAAAVCLAVLLLYRGNTRRTMRRLDEMLDEAIRGDFAAGRYDESQLSKIESKMSRFLSASRLKKGQIEHEQDKLRALISDISHQTKTPISNIVLYAQLLNEQEGLPADAGALAGQIAGGAEKLNFLIQSLVKISRLESGIIKLSPQRGEPAALIADAMEDCAAKARRRGVTLRFDAPPEPIFAVFDARWCAEALYNILDNAVKYTGAGGEVCAVLTAYEMFVRIDVRDTGRGIREEEIAKVFERFWRGKDSPAAEGVGIGLYLAREIIVGCGGYVKVRSEYGKGSVFSVFLPADNCDKMRIANRYS
ncbi:MAG: HAMP domain-containing histidine kinase [Clostridiales Family XIII bacterium]|jgi:signal transduction histidine kinase|nr:HAMP domain-containing histidine kinase [Clostridiales Family XIII bacterium]